jgi:predicted nuclease of restriction endonuclease-like RecB superfamily
LSVKIRKRFTVPGRDEEAMLIREHSIVDYKVRRAYPDRLTRTRHRHYTDYAGQMLDVYRNGTGKCRRELHRRIEKIFDEEPDCPVRRIKAFCKLLDEKSVFESDKPQNAARLRIDVFSRAAAFHPLVKSADRLFEHDESRVRKKISEEMGLSWEQIKNDLYSDVLDYQRLQAFEGYPDAGALLSRYNVAQLQSSLYSAESMTVIATRDLKTILRHAKLARLMHEITYLGPSRYEIVFSGPASVLRRTHRYGVFFAKFLPALLSCRGWKMTALLKTPWNSTVTLRVSDKDGYSTHIQSPKQFDSSVEEALASKFGDKRDRWRIAREGEILHCNQKVFFPDFTFYHEDGTKVLLEIVGYWRPEYLAIKRRVLEQFRNHRIIIAVNEKSVRKNAKIGENTLVYKTAIKLSALMKILERMRSRASVSTKK